MATHVAHKILCGFKINLYLGEHHSLLLDIAPTFMLVLDNKYVCGNPKTRVMA